MSLDAKLKQSLLETAARHRLRRGKSGRQTARNLVDLTCTLKKKDLPEYLLNAIERSQCSTVTGNRIDLDHPAFSLNKTMEAFEKDLIGRALSESRNLSAAARKLKISKQTLSYKMNKYNLD